MDGVDMAEVGRIDQDADFFLGLAGGGGEDGFAGVKFP